MYTHCNKHVSLFEVVLDMFIDKGLQIMSHTVLESGAKCAT